MTKRQSPQISIILPVYNASKYISECLDSILAQTYSDFEVIAVEDSSDDNSREILEMYAKKDSRIKTFQNKKNLGVSRSLNMAISKSSGKYLARMDADDIMHEERLYSQKVFLNKNTRHVLVGSQVNLIDEQGRKIGLKRFPPKHAQIRDMLFVAMPLQHPAIMINRENIPDTFTWYDESLETAEDADLFYRLLKFGLFANIDEFLLDYRKHSQAITSRMTKKLFRLTIHVRRKAVKEYGYKPKVWARGVDLMQRMVVSILPEGLITKVYDTFRGLIL